MAVFFIVYLSGTSLAEKEKDTHGANKSVEERQSEARDIRDIKGVIKPSFRFLHVITVLVLAFSLGLISVHFIAKRKRKRIIPPAPAYKIACEALDLLKRKDFIKEGKIREYYIELSDIVRNYLATRFGLKASVMTTEELLAELRGTNGHYSPACQNIIEDFLNISDPVKFAGYEPSDAETDRSFSLAKEIIEQTRTDQII